MRYVAAAEGARGDAQAVGKGPFLDDGYQAQTPFSGRAYSDCRHRWVLALEDARDSGCKLHHD